VSRFPTPPTTPHTATDHRPHLFVGMTPPRPAATGHTRAIPTPMAVDVRLPPPPGNEKPHRPQRRVSRGR
jgi:hypothetical protein